MTTIEKILREGLENLSKYAKDQEDAFVAQTHLSRADAVEDDWIAVSDKLPEIGVDVLCIWNEGSEMMVVDYLERRSVSDANCVQFVKNYTHNYSHWQPLPKPPKGAKHE